jgi:predicted DNA-binding mobile mystery protein A
MNDAIRHLDQRFEHFRSLSGFSRPPKGWLRAIRDALGMTTAQFGRRIGVSQPRAVAIEKAEISGAITLHSLERAAEALGCRLVYALVPERPLSEIVQTRAESLARQTLSAVDQTMMLEDQAVHQKAVRKEMWDKLIMELLQNPARLWDQS